MKKLDNFIFDNSIVESLKAFLVLNGEKLIKENALIFAVDKEHILDVLLHLLFLYKVKLDTQIIVDSEEDFNTLMGKFYIFIGKALPKEFLEHTKKELEEFKHIVPFLSINEDVKQFYMVFLMIKTLRKLCPWDREQTHQTLIPEIVEEPLELLEEIKRGKVEGIKEELGDVLLQILLHSEIASESNEFSFKDVAITLFDKMYERHPHVFRETIDKSSRQVLHDWEKNKNKKETINIAKILASFITTLDIQEEAKFIGLEFRNNEEIFQKIEEEVEEVKNAKDNIKEEIGDLLFSVINLARFLKIDPAHALFLSYEKFAKRVERFKQLSPKEKEDIDKAWEIIKRNEK